MWDITVVELLFATKIRISELCSLKSSYIDLKSNNILLYGKAAKERILQIGNPEVITALKQYYKHLRKMLKHTDTFRRQATLQAVEPDCPFYDKHYAELAEINQHTPAHISIFVCYAFRGARHR